MGHGAKNSKGLSRKKNSNRIRTQPCPADVCRYTTYEDIGTTPVPRIQALLLDTISFVRGGRTSRTKVYEMLKMKRIDRKTEFEKPHGCTTARQGTP